MGKQFPERIDPGLLLGCIQHCLCQYLAVPVIDRAPVVAGQQYLLAGVVAVVDHILLPGSHEIPQEAYENHK